MKKIILGCAAVLLSLGLLAGCNNEESDKAVSIKVDTAATVVVGESLSLPYTVEPEKAEIEVLNNHEEYVTAVAQEGTLYLEGVAEGSATVTLVGTYKKYTEANVSIAVSVVTESTADTGPGEEEPGDTGDTEPGEQVITLSVDPIETTLIAGGEPVEVTYKVEPTEAEDGIDMVVVDTSIATVAHTDGWYLTPVAEGETTLTVTATLEEYETASVVIDIVVHEEGWTEPEPLTERENYTLTVTFAAAIPDYADAYITGCLGGGTNTDSDWVNYAIDSTGKMTVSEDKYSLSYTFEKVAVGNIAINIYFEYNANAQYHDAATAATWSHNVFEGAVTWAVISDDENTHETVLTVETDPSTIITDNNDFCELTIAIKNTDTNEPQTGFAEGFAPYFYHWAHGNSGDSDESKFTSMNRGACGEYTTSSDYYFTVATDGSTLDGNETYYTISQGDKFEFQITVSEDNNWNDVITIASGTTVPSEVEASESSRVITITSAGTSCESALVVFEFDFSACQTNGTWSENPYNLLITNITYVANWY